MVTFPNAKINLGLDILRKRPDGYHDIETLFYPIGWRDILEIVPAKGVETTLTVTGRAVDCPVEKNLVMKAYRLLDNMVSLPPCDIYLHKVIPDGAGLGGGSSDAAFTLLSLNELFNLGIRKDELSLLASSLGADCPFFIHDKPMLAKGTGTELEEIDFSLKGYGIVVVKPHFSISTKEAYAGCCPQIPVTKIEDIIKKPVSEWQDLLSNGFECGLEEKYPQINEIKTKLSGLGAIYTSMTGSGSAVFGIFEGDILADDWEKQFDDCEIFNGLLN